MSFFAKLSAVWATITDAVHTVEVGLHAFVSHFVTVDQWTEIKRFIVKAETDALHGVIDKGAKKSTVLAKISEKFPNMPEWAANWTLETIVGVLNGKFDAPPAA